MMNESEVIKAHLSCDVSNERFQLTSRVHLPRCIHERLHLGKIGHDPASLYVTKLRDWHTIAPAHAELLLQIKSIVVAIEEHISKSRIKCMTIQVNQRDCRIVLIINQ